MDLISEFYYGCNKFIIKIVNSKENSEQKITKKIVKTFYENFTIIAVYILKDRTVCLKLV